MKKKTKRFWFHYNKPASAREKKNILTIHWDSMCHRVNSIKCLVATESHNRNSQPRCIIRGFATSVTLIDNEDGGVDAVII